MKIYTNEPFIKRKQKTGVYLSVVGLIVMSLAFVAVWWPQYTLAAWGLLILGAVISVAGTYHINRWLRPPNPEPILADTLRRFDSRYVLFNHSGVVPHLLLTPNGLVAIKVKRYEGPVTYTASSNRWQGKVSLRRLYGHGLTAEGAGNPVLEVEEMQERVRAWLLTKVPDIADEIPVEGVALFLSPKVVLHGDEPPVPVAQPSTLKKVVQGLVSKHKPLARPTYQRLRRALEAEQKEDVEEAA